MQKRKLSSLLLISFIVVFAFSYSMANQVTFESKSNLPRCTQGFQKITVAPSQEITGFEIVFKINSTAGGEFVDPVTVAWTTAVPAGWYKDVDLTHADGIAPDTIRLIALRLGPSLPTLAAGSYVVANISYTTNDVCEGSVAMSGAEWSWLVNPSGPIVTQFTDLVGDLLSVAVTAGTLSVVNNPPTIDPITNKTAHWGGNLTPITAAGYDIDVACEKLTLV